MYPVSLTASRSHSARTNLAALEAERRVTVLRARWLAWLVVSAATLVGCHAHSVGELPRDQHVDVRAFGRLADGSNVRIYTITNAHGMSAKVTEYGATLTELWSPDRDGKLTDVVLGYSRLEDYVAAPFYLGATLGRVANRIANGKFVLDGKTYTLATNRAPNHLHGGVRGFDKQVWKSSPRTNGVEFTYTSRDGEEGYPGTLETHVVYTLTDANELRIEYTATTDKPTPLNFTNHSFFNLAGSGTMLDQVLTINASHFTPGNSSLVPTGEIARVAGTPLDFTRPRKIGSRIDEMRNASNGYDHNLVLDRTGRGPSLAARLEDDKSGRVLEIWTTEPGLQFFTGNRFDGSFPGVGGVKYEQHAGVALEPQHFPDAINHPNFPPVVLRPGETFRSTTIYRFTTRSHG